MVEAFVEGLYKGVVEENMELYQQFFRCDPTEEGTIEHWRRAIGLYDKLDEKDRKTLLSIIESTIVDSVSNVLAIFDGTEGVDGVNLLVKLNGEDCDGELQDAFLDYVEEKEARPSDR